MKTYIRPLIAFAVIITIVACGPSPETIAETYIAQTAAASTDTPVPTALPTATPTSTPVPYDLTVSVTNHEGVAIGDARVTVAEVAGDETATQQTNTKGTAVWADLPGEQTTLQIYAQGYLPLEERVVLARGNNAVTYALEVDPFGLRPEEVAQSGEAILFIEDFQDQDDDFAEIVGDWQIVEEADNPGNFVIHCNQRGEGLVDAAYVVFGPEELNDFILTYRFRWVDVDFTRDGSEDDWQFTSISWDDYILDSYPINGGWHQLIDRSQSEWTFPMQMQMAFTSDRWYSRRAEIIGDEISTYFDGRLLTRIGGVRAPQNAGPLILNAGPQAIVEYDDIVLMTPGR